MRRPFTHKAKLELMRDPVSLWNRVKIHKDKLPNGRTLNSVPVVGMGRGLKLRKSFLPSGKGTSTAYIVSYSFKEGGKERMIKVVFDAQGRPMSEE